jgi:hypothetical protein
LVLRRSLHRVRSVAIPDTFQKWLPVVYRCILCGGEGQVGWEGKFSHLEPCPRCLGRRYVNCRECGGFFHRPIFDHRTVDPASAAKKMKAGWGSEDMYQPGMTATLTALYD